MGHAALLTDPGEVRTSASLPLTREEPACDGGIGCPPAPRVLRATDLSTGSGSGLQLPLGQGSLNLSESRHLSPGPATLSGLWDVAHPACSGILRRRKTSLVGKWLHIPGGGGGVGGPLDAETLGWVVALESFPDSSIAQAPQLPGWPLGKEQKGRFPLGIIFF